MCLACCIDFQNELPTISFVGGATEPLSFDFYHKLAGLPYDFTNSVCNFAISGYAVDFATPIISKEMTIGKSSVDGTNSVLSVVLDPADTVNLHGKYLYQISILGAGNEIDIPRQGIMYIARNINRGFILG